MAVNAELINTNFSWEIILQTVLGFVAAVCLIKLAIFAWRFDRLKRVLEAVPGPPRRFILGNVGQAVSIQKDTHFPSNVYLLWFISALSMGFSIDGIVKAWLIFRPVVILLQANTVEPLLSSNIAVDKSPEYRFLRGWLGTGLLTSSGKKWKSRRKMLTPSFHFRILDDFQPIISEQSNVLVQTLKDLPNLHCPDIMENITLCALDIIGETSLGVKLSAQAQQNTKYVKALSVIGNVAMYRVLRPWLWNDIVFALTPTGRKYRRSLRILHDFTKDVIRERKINYKSNSGTENGKRRMAFLDLLLEEHFRDESFTEKDIQEEVDTFTFEGHDTTAIGMSWCLYLLGLNPDVQQKAYEEMVEIFGSDKDTPITIDHLKEMKYLDMVIKEALRLYPPVPLIARELKQDLIIEKKVIPAGASCFVSIPELHRDKKCFPNPEVFDPDRFLPENCVGRSPYAYIPFAAGPRNCIGQRFAVIEEKTIVANVLRNFQLTSLDHRDKIIVCPQLVSRAIPYLRMQLRLRD